MIWENLPKGESLFSPPTWLDVALGWIIAVMWILLYVFG